MDPNANIQAQLELVTGAISLRDLEDTALLDGEEIREIIDDHLDLCDHVEALHEWIRKGGFLPDVWQYSQDQYVARYVRDTLEEYFPWLKDPQRPSFTDLGLGALEDIAVMHKNHAPPKRPSVKPITFQFDCDDKDVVVSALEILDPDADKEIERRDSLLKRLGDLPKLLKEAMYIGMLAVALWGFTQIPQ